MESKIESNVEAASPEVASPSQDVGQENSNAPFLDENGKLGYIGLAIIGVTLATLFYTIYWYRKNIQMMEEEREDANSVAREVSEIKKNLKALLGSQYQSI